MPLVVMQVYAISIHKSSARIAIVVILNARSCEGISTPIKKCSTPDMVSINMVEHGGGVVIHNNPYNTFCCTSTLVYIVAGTVAMLNLTSLKCNVR
jgi:hypothetical protein